MPEAEPEPERIFRSVIEDKFATTGDELGREVSDDPDWRPDVATLRWLTHGTDAELVADAMKSDVPPRQQASGDYTEDTMWSFAADAAIEAIMFTAMRRANEMDNRG